MRLVYLLKLATGSRLSRKLEDIGLTPIPGGTDEQLRQQWRDGFLALGHGSPEYVNLLINEYNIAGFSESSLDISIANYTYGIRAINAAAADLLFTSTRSAAGV